jgi:hypothetical protein
MRRIPVLDDIEVHMYDLKDYNRKKNKRPFIIPDRIIEFIAESDQCSMHYSGHWNRI